MRTDAQEIAQRFGETVMILRKRAGISQEELGFLASLHRTEIGSIERGHRLARIDTVVKLAGALEVSPERFFRGMGWSPGGPRIGSFRVREDEEQGNG